MDKILQEGRAEGDKEKDQVRILRISTYREKLPEEERAKESEKEMWRSGSDEGKGIKETRQLGLLS